MSSAYNLLLLHASQAELALHRAQNNVYSDKRKQEYQEKLAKLFKAVSKDISKNAGVHDTVIYNSYKPFIDFIFVSLEFLDSSTFNQIPYEIVECLDHAMKDWLQKGDNFIIVTSLQNNIQRFSFDPSLVLADHLYKEINSRYNIDFPYKLVQINLPRTLSRDYLSSVVLYHELGHFVDMRYNFTSSLARTLLNDLSANKLTTDEIKGLSSFMPFLTQLIGKPPAPSNSDAYKVTQWHLGEYFSDLFAAQYIGYSSNFYLTYVTNNSSSVSSTHPSTINRVKVVTDFLTGADNVIVNMLNKAISTVLSGRSLNVLFDNVAPDDFIDLLPVEVDSEKKLHGLYNMAWTIWLNNQSDIAKSINATEPLKSYSVINNLMEKSIGNFITTNKWIKAQHQLQSRQVSQP